MNRLEEKKTLIITMIVFFFIASCQEAISQKEKVSNMSQEEIIDKYVKEGAWKCCNMYSQAWQKKLDEALEIDSTIAYVWQQKAMPLFKQMKYEVGMKYLDNAVKYNPEKWLEYRAFIKCIFIKDYSDAIKDFQKCKEQYGNRVVMDHSYDFYIALSNIQLNNFEMAENILTKQINETINKDDLDWVHFLDFFYLGISQLEQGKYEESINSFNSSLEKYPQFSDALYYKGLATINLGEPEKGMNMAEEAKSLKEYTINEDNSIYERYPYKVNWKATWWVD